MAEQLILTVERLYWGEIRYMPYFAKIFLEVYNDEGEAQYFANLALQPVILLEKYEENLEYLEYKDKDLNIKHDVNGFKLTVKTKEQLLAIILDEHIAELFWKKLKNMVNTIRKLHREHELEEIQDILTDPDNPIEF